jgi:cytochrome P450
MAATQPKDDYRDRPDNHDLDHIPGTWGYPIVGSALALIDDLLALARKHKAEYGNISRLRLGPQKGVMVLGADNFQKIFLDRDKNFSAEMGYVQQLGKFYRGGLLLRDFDDHKFQRRVMQTAFKTPAMKNYVAMMNPIFDSQLKDWPTGKQLVFFPLIKELLLEIGAKIFIGVEDYKKDAKVLSDGFLNVNEGLSAIIHLKLPGTKFYKGMKGKDALHQFFADIIPQRREGSGQDMLSFMCQEKTDEDSYYTDSDLIEHAAFLLFAAHDTTTSVLSHMMMYLGLNPEWQDKLRAEAKSIDKENLEYDDLEKLKLMDFCINECLRLHPSVPLMTRRTINEVELDGHRIPAETMLFLPGSFNHREDIHWSNPEQFDPLRFDSDRLEQKNHSFCYHPFGGGAHKCIGLHFASMLAKTFLHKFLLQYKFTVPQGYAPKMNWVPLPKPADGVPFTIEKL